MKSTITIGRSSRCDIIIPNDSVSREHGRLNIVGGNYVYEDVGKNGSVIGGRVIHGQRVTVAAGTEILLAGKVPLPWAQIYTMLPLKGVRPYDNETHYESVQNNSPQYIYVEDKNIGVGYGILAFLIPLTGWIMYFIWKDNSPNKASQANAIAWISFIINILGIFTIL